MDLLLVSGTMCLWAVLFILSWLIDGKATFALKSATFGTAAIIGIIGVLTLFHAINFG